MKTPTHLRKLLVQCWRLLNKREKSWADIGRHLTHSEEIVIPGLRVDNYTMENINGHFVTYSSIITDENQNSLVIEQCLNSSFGFSHSIDIKHEK